MTNDTAVYDAMRFDLTSGEPSWIDRMGTREAIIRDGLAIDPHSLTFCPHEWINDSGYVDLTLVQKSPRPFSV